ncbi:hypothetical protein BS78_10G141200 [Paspalum vaginatum]|nr:hypothetical protein BS78_10G141200 [Paspalum vaginatum]KAJ1259273.1 hypothetical protein BS78_10G141200 [Paspalum vaginatum]KAJ1259274.1 hypothetical protein BS78_10G141200 [Paspalum vaginatum]
MESSPSARQRSRPPIPHCLATPPCGRAPSRQRYGPPAHRRDLRKGKEMHIAEEFGRRGQGGTSASRTVGTQSFTPRTKSQVRRPPVETGVARMAVACAASNGAERVLLEINGVECCHGPCSFINYEAYMILWNM